MSKYEKTFCSTSGEEFRADVYSVLEAFGVSCPARQHAVKKLLMAGKRGHKDEIQDLQEAIVSMSRAAGMARARLPEGGQKKGESAVACNDITLTEIEIDASGRVTVRSGCTLTGEPEAEAGLKPERRPLVAVRSLPPDYTPPQFPWQVLKPDAASDQRAEPEPEPEPKPKLVTWRRCVRIQPREIDGYLLCTDWFSSGSIPEDWYPIESYERPIETVKRLPEGQKP